MTTATANFHIEGRRWFDKTYGNTYHTVRIFQEGKELVYIPFTYGYGEQYLQTAIDWLIANNLMGLDLHFSPNTRKLREEMGASWSVIDVTRKRDL